MSSLGLRSFLLKLLFFILIFQYLANSEDGDNNYGDGGAGTPTTCNNSTICQYPCHPQAPPPPATGYAAPQPPGAGVNCPPSAPVQCCGGSGGSQYYVPPSPFYYPYNNYSGAATADRGQILDFHVALGYSLVLYCFVV